jgi:hypothetical protein
MGAGDWVMCTGEVKVIHEKYGQPVMVVGPDGRMRWDDVFDNNPRIIRRPIKKPYRRLINGGGFRPYIASKSSKRWMWRAYKPIPGELYFTADEEAFAAPHAGAVMIEPNGKDIGHDNKVWPFERWQAVVDALPGMPFVQCGPPGTRWLERVKQVETPNFRSAAAVLRGSKTFVGGEGGLMHAAAAVGRPALILWSEFIAPHITGYEMHRNIRHAGPPCGWRIPCETCRASLLAITVDEVVHNLKEMV